MRLRKRDGTGADSAVAVPQGGPEEPKEPIRTRASSSKRSEKGDGKSREVSNATSGEADENTPVNNSSRVSHMSSIASPVPLFNVRALRSSSRSGLRSSRAAKSGTVPLEKKKAAKKPGKGAKLVQTAEKPQQVQESYDAPVESSTGDEESGVARGAESMVPVEEPNPFVPTGDDAAERLTQEANERAGTDEDALSNSKSIVPPKTFYGEAASSTKADDIQQRLQEFSFTRRASFQPSPAGTLRKKKRNIRPKAFKASSKRTHRKNSKDCCGRPVILLGSNSLLFQSNGEPRQVSLESRKFFKHHIPIGQYRCVLDQGVPRFLTAPQRATKKGLIDFDFKEDVISHVAEEGGKCNNFGLASVDDLERSGIPKVNLLQENRFNLRKRKSTSDKNNKPKRRRASSWRYAEDDVPVGNTYEGRSPGRSENGPLTESLEEFRIVTKDVPKILVPRRRRIFRTKRAKIVAEAYEEPTILVHDETESRAKTAATFAHSDRAEIEKSQQPRDVPKGLGAASGESTMAKKKKNGIPKQNPSNITEQIGGQVPGSASGDAKQVPRPPRCANNDPPPEPAPMKRVTRRASALPPVPEPESPSPIDVDSTTIDFSPVACGSPRLSPSPPPPSSPASSSVRVPSPNISRTLTRRTVPHSTPVDPSTSKPQSKVTKPYNPRDDAFGFSRVQFKARSSLENPFVEVFSPTKRPRELTPKIMAPRNTQPTVKEVLEKSAKALATSTPTKKDASFRMSGVGASSSKRLTSTPWDPAGKRGFYGASTLKKTTTDGFKGLSRLIDRLGSKQLQIDAGQKNYGAKECKTCGMVFSQGEAEDERKHQRFHKQMNSALQVRFLGGIRVVDVLPDVGRAVLVSAKDSKGVKEKLSDVLTFANRTVGLDSDVVAADFYSRPERIFAAFVHSSGKIVSVIGAEPWNSAHRTVPGQGLMLDTSKTHSVKSSIFFIWTLPEFRRKGLAGLLLYRMRSILRPGGEPLTFEELAFADLTPDLYKFATALSGQDTVFVAAPPDPNLEAPV